MTTFANVIDTTTTQTQIKEIIMNELKAQLDRIERMLMASQKNMLSVNDVAILTGMSKASIYGLCNKRKIPFYKQGKTFFDRAEIENWLRQNRIPTKAEVESKAQMYCHTH